MRTPRRSAALATLFLLTANPMTAVLLGRTAPAYADRKVPSEYRQRSAPPQEELAPEPAPAPAPALATAPTLGGVWADLRWCESSDDYTANTGNGYYGAYQFSATTWWWLGYEGWPHHAPPWVQDEAAVLLHSIYGWSPWPGCSWKLGLR